MPATLLGRSSPVRSAVRDRPIRIGFVIDNLSRAGTESQLLALIRSLDRSRFEPSLVLLDGTSEASRELEPMDCDVHRMGLTKLLGCNGYRAAKRLRQIWNDRRPDIVQAYFLDASYFAIPIARSLRVPKIVRVRNNLGYWLTRKHRLMNRLVRGWVDVSLTNSEMGRETLIAKDGLASDRVVAIENGVDLDRFANFDPPQFAGTITIGCVANLRAVKNVDGLMHAARRVLDRFSNVVFEVAGDGEQRPDLERLHRELNLGDRFALRGSLADVAGFLRGCDMAVLPSHSEGMSNALLEYMASGRAIVATDVGANAKLARHRREGWIATDSKPETLAAAMLGLINDPTIAKRMAADARIRAESEYSREAMVRRFENFYLELADSEKVAGGRG